MGSLEQNPKACPAVEGREGKVASTGLPLSNDRSLVGSVPVVNGPNRHPERRTTSRQVHDKGKAGCAAVPRGFEPDLLIASIEYVAISNRDQPAGDGGDAGCDEPRLVRRVVLSAQRERREA